MSPGGGAGGSAECTKGSGLHWEMLGIGLLCGGSVDCCRAEGGS